MVCPIWASTRSDSRCPMFAANTSRSVERTKPTSAPGMARASAITWSQLSVQGRRLANTAASSHWARARVKGSLISGVASRTRRNAFESEPAIHSACAAATNRSAWARPG